MSFLTDHDHDHDYLHDDSDSGMTITEKPPTGSTPATSDEDWAIDDKNHLVYERDNIVGPGLLRDDIYDQQLGKWRAGLRRILVKNLKKESEWLGILQQRLRTPALDTYFVYTSSLGTHTFFMTLLPAFFFFGHDRAGASLVQVLGLGVYFSSLIKDSICSPRPLAPPVTRLTVGTHHLEYGFPSTHSTNSISIALHFWSILYTAYQAQLVERYAYWLGVAALLWYAFSIVFGRLYCAMHSFTDVAVGVVLGAAIWSVQWTYGALLETWMRTPGWQVPTVIVPLTLILVNQHPDPVDDCPCFEDSIAFLSVIMGVTLATWWRANWGFDVNSGFFVAAMPQDWMMWWAVAAGKMVLGVLMIFTFRLVAKPIFHVVLPPIFRGLSTLFTLPNRRFYTPATDYESVPRESLLYHPIPSMIDLPAMVKAQQEEHGTGLPLNRTSGLKMRSGVGVKFGVGEKAAATRNEVHVVAPEKIKVKHYDADVLTKVGVYAGIGFVASGLIPVMFELLGWGVYH